MRRSLLTTLALLGAAGAQTTTPVQPKCDLSLAPGSVYLRTLVRDTTFSYTGSPLSPLSDRSGEEVSQQLDSAGGFTLTPGELPAGLSLDLVPVTNRSQAWLVLKVRYAGAGPLRAFDLKLNYTKGTKVRQASLRVCPG